MSLLISLLAVVLLTISCSASRTQTSLSYEAKLKRAELALKRERTFEARTWTSEALTMQPERFEAQKLMEFHIIEHMELINSLGRVVEQWNNLPTKFWFDTNKYSDGVYMLKVKTNIQSETLPIVIIKH